MTKEGILARGKENYEKGRFPENSETLAYVDSMKAEKPIEKPIEKPKEKTNGKSNE